MITNSAVTQKTCSKTSMKFRMLEYKRYFEGYLMILPFLLLFALFVVVPVFWGMILSLTHYNMMQPMIWAGFSNYIELFLNDDLFITALRNTFWFAAIAGPVGFFASFFFAWVINQLKFRDVFSLAFYAPSIVSGIAISIIWLFLFSSDRIGLINSTLLNMGLISEPMLWTMDPRLIMPLIIFISVWMSLGTGFLTNLAGLSNINIELFEAGAIDGIKNKFQELYYITYPQMKPQLLFNAIMSTVASLNVHEIAVTVAGFPSPDYSAHTVVGHMYDHGFIRFELGYASAIAFVLFAMNFLLGRLFMRFFSTKDE